MSKDTNAKLNKVIAKKERDAKEWRRQAKQVKNKDPKLSSILEARARKIDGEILNLQMKLK